VIFLPDTNTCISLLRQKQARLIARYDLTLVTHNTREFARISALRLEDWES